MPEISYWDRLVADAFKKDAKHFIPELTDLLSFVLMQGKNDPRV
jgi:hypothetical protein